MSSGKLKSVQAKNEWPQLTMIINHLPVEDRLPFRSMGNSLVHDLRNTFGLISYAEDILRKQLDVSAADTTDSELMDIIKLAIDRATHQIGEFEEDFVKKISVDAEK